MRLELSDAKALAEIPPSAVTAYLRTRGWEPSDIKQDLGFFRKELDGETIECDVPLRQHARDYPHRVRELLDNLALIEQRSQFDIYQDLLRTNQDIIRISIDVPESGRMGLDEAGVLFSATRDLVLAAACATHTRRAYFPSRKPQRASEYVRQVHLATPEAGSFVVVLESPLPSSFAQRQALEADSAVGQDEPFERLALLTLASAGMSVQRSIEISTARGTIDRFAEDVQAGVSANYCDALATMLEVGPGRDVSIAFSWSASRPVDRSLAPRLVFSKHEASLLRDAARYLKDRGPLAGFELTGQIVRLETSGIAHGGSVTVAGLVENSIRQVQLFVGPDEYRSAIEAHRHERTITVEGELIRDGRSFRLGNPRLFSVM